MGVMKMTKPTFGRYIISILIILFFLYLLTLKHEPAIEKDIPRSSGRKTLEYTPSYIDPRPEEDILIRSEG